MQDDAGLETFCEGVWVHRAPVRILGTRLSTTMTLVRLPDGSLLVYSPVALTPSLRHAAEALGPVKHLYAPNLFHHRWLGEWAAAFPGARVHAPGGLREKRPELRIDRTIAAEPEPAFSGVIDEMPVNGCRLDETVVFVRPAKTLLVADLVHNVGQPEGAWTRLYTRTMGFYDRVALSRVLRWTAFADRSAARSSVDELLALPFERMIVGHGTPLTNAAQQALAAAYAWLR